MTRSTSSDLEKDSIRVNENANVTTTPLYNEHVDITGVDERKLLRKIDIALIPWLSLLYLLSFLDRTSIGKCVSILIVKLCAQRFVVVPRYHSLSNLGPVCLTIL